MWTQASHLLVGLALLAWIARVQGACRFPEAWSGRWFQSGVTQLLAINASLIETKGSCVEHDGDKYILEDKWEQCFRCVVIHEKHHNVLQYKETFCVPRGPLEQLCGEITGDATLFSMYRSDAAPVACPFKGPFSFTYNRGSGECARPPSRIDSCAEDSRLRMRYQACADVLGSESSSEELECLATWKDGNTRYLVGKLAHKMASTDEDRYRCFVYERAPHEHPATFRVAQSGDATCNGLLSATEGSRTMRLTKESHASQCKFPGWVTEHHHWRTLDHRRSFQFSHKNATLRISNETSRDDEAASTSLELRATCHSQLDLGERHVLLVAHVTLGCESGYMCMLFQRRDTHVIELQQTSNFAHAADEACQSSNFDVSMLPFITLVTASLKPRKCPYLGRYTVSSLSREGARASRSRASSVACSSEELESLVVGCRASDTMEFHSSCGTEPVSAYSCHGSWEDNGTHFLVASPLSRRSTGARRFCFVYAETERGLHFSSVADVCERVGVAARPGSWAFNATLDGVCAESPEMQSSSPTSRGSPLLLGFLVLFMLHSWLTSLMLRTPR